VPLELSGAVSALSDAASSGEPLGVCCYNDDVAIAVLAAAREMSLAVPETVAVIGVDHTKVGQLVAPRLTTIALDLPALTHAFADELGLQPSDASPGTLVSTDALVVVAGESA
jgi:DNA-binding LacI/PurR family transcriptional regulator